MAVKLPKSLWRFYFKYGIRGHWPLLIAWAVVYLLTGAQELFWPISQRWTVAIFEADVPAGMTLLEHAMPTIIAILVIFIVIDLVMLLSGALSARWRPIVQNQISEVLNDYVHSQSMRFWTGGMSGKVFSQINYVARGFRVIDNFWRVFSVLIIICINAGMIFQINKYIALLFALSFVLRFAYSWAMVKPMNRTAQDASTADSTLSGHTIDSLSNYYIVKLFAGAKSEREHLKEPRKKQIKTSIDASFMQRMFWGVPMILWEVFYAAVLVICCILFTNGNIKISDVVFTISVYMTIMGLIGYIVRGIPDIVDMLSSASRAYKELNQPIDVMDVENAEPLVVSHGRIEFKNVFFKYKNKYVLRDLNLVIKPGERVGLVGASGAGKTTLVNLLMRFYEPTRGQILIDGVDIHDVTQDSLRQNISFIPQDPTMFNRTLRENISYGRPDATDAEIKRAARMAAADKFINGTEKKYDSMVGDRGIKLSGGQRQRIAIARAFLKDAPILILDEATSALDSETEIAIQSSFEKLAVGRTTIAIAHRLSTLRNMDRIVVLESGKIIEQGTHSQLIRKKGEYARLWKMQSGGFIKEE